MTRAVKRTRQVLLALLLTVMPTAVLLAGVESYNPASCVTHPILQSPWAHCQMNGTSGSYAGDWTADATIQSGGYSHCALTLENGSAVYFWAWPMGTVTSSRQGACDDSETYNYKKQLGNPKPNRYLRCKSLAAPPRLPSQFSVTFDDNPGICVSPDT